MAKSTWKTLRDKYLKARNDNPTMQPSGAGNPDKYDWSLLLELSFLKEFVSNRPVISSMELDKESSMDHHHQPPQGFLVSVNDEVAHFRRPDSVLKGPTLQERIAAYETALPPVVPKLDALGIRNQLASTKIYDSAETILRHVEALQEKAINSQQDPSSENFDMFAEVFDEEFKYIPQSKHAQVYLEICQSIKRLE